MPGKKTETIHYDNGDVYHGQIDDEERPHGKGKYTHHEESGQVRTGEYDGSWENGQKHGKGKHCYRNGDVYDGPWQNGKRHGRHGKYTYHKTTPKQSTEYVGDWENDQKHGRGTMKFSNDDVYEGDWVNNNMESNKATYTYKDGSKYEGSWENDEKSGEGVLKYANGDEYRGQFKKGMRHGKGIYTFKKGKSTEGYYENDKRVGGKPDRTTQATTTTTSSHMQPSDIDSLGEESDN